MQNKIRIIKNIFGCVGMTLVLAVAGSAYAQGANEIYGYVFEETARIPVVAAEVWYCSSPVPEEFPVCLAQRVGQTDGNGKWVFRNPAPNYYYRIWATKLLGAYSQTFAQFYSGGSLPWVDLRIEGTRQTPNITIISPDSGCRYSDRAMDISWSTTLTDVDRFTIGFSMNESTYDFIAQVPGNLRSYSWGPQSISDSLGSYSWAPGQKVFWLRIAVVAHGQQGQFLGQDFSDAQVQIASACPVSVLSANNIRAVDITDTGAKIAWETNVPAVATVEYKIGTLARPDGFATAVTSDFITSHATALTYLLPNTTYYYYIRLWDALRNEFRTKTFSFTTRAAASSPIVSTPIVSAAVQEVVVTKSAVETIVAEISDGARVVIPPAAALAEGLVTVAIKTAVQPPKESGIEVVGPVYDIAIQDAANRIVKDLAGEIEIVLPYRDTDISKLGVGENEAFPAYYDDSAKKWIKIENYTQDAVNNIIVARVKHLTRFAIVAAADVTPPAAPTGIAIRALVKGGIALSWKNPARDFHHAKIYRSERAGIAGAVVGSEIFGQEFADNQTGIGVLYYYTIRAVDPAGNESLNKKQYNVRAQAVFVKNGDTEGAARFQNIRVGDRGERVRIVQEVLADEGLYPAGLAHGFFDEYTKQAAILFQEKYAEDILTPAGITKGTGVVGAATWKKVSELRAAKQASQKKPEEPEEAARSEERAAELAPQPKFFVRWWRALLLFFGLK